MKKILKNIINKLSYILEFQNGWYSLEKQLTDYLGYNIGRKAHQMLMKEICEGIGKDTFLYEEYYIYKPYLDLLLKKYYFEFHYYKQEDELIVLLYKKIANNTLSKQVQARIEKNAENIVNVNKLIRQEAIFYERKETTPIPAKVQDTKNNIRDSVRNNIRDFNRGDFSNVQKNTNT